MLPLQKVSEIINRHSELEKDLSSSNLDSKTFAKKSKEYSDLNEIIKNAQDYFNFNDNKNELDKIINDRNSDEEMKQLAKQELDEIIKNHTVSEINVCVVNSQIF